MTETMPYHASAPGRAHGADLSPLLAPRTVAVIGAARRENSMGHQLLSNLIDYGFSGTVYPVNPHAPSIRSVHAYPSIGAVPAAVDLAVIVVPKEQALEAVEACGEAGVKGLIVITAGFREIGGCLLYTSDAADE